MDLDVPEAVLARAAVHRALGDPVRLLIAELVSRSDHTPSELRALTGMEWNLLSHHLGVLEAAGVVQRRASDGDHRRRYVRLAPGAPADLTGADLAGGSAHAVTAPLFVCTHNSARSPFAEGLWQQMTGGVAWSAGTNPGPAVHPMAVEVAAAFGVDLAAVSPKGFTAVGPGPDAVVSVCDRAFEDAVPFDLPRIHWSVGDPSTTGDRDAFLTAFTDIAARVTRLAGAAA